MPYDHPVSRCLGLIFCGLTLLLGAVALPSYASDPVPTLSIPAEPSGVIMVTASADPAAYPYLAIGLSNSADQWSATTEVATALQANDGSLQSLPVETWGLTSSAIFTLLGCSAADIATCNPIARTAVPVTQSDGATATIRIPNDNSATLPAFYLLPGGTSATVTGTSAGDGDLEVEVARPESSTDPDDWQPLADDTATDVDYDYGSDPTDYTDVKVWRCSPYGGTAVCEQLDAVGRLVVHSLSTSRLVRMDLDGTTRATSNMPLMTDGSTRGGAATFTVAALLGTSVSLPMTDLKWSLADASGAVIDSMDVPVPSNPDPNQLLTVNPSADLGYAPPDGQYTLTVYTTVSRGNTSLTGTATYPVTLEADPPATEPPAPTAVSTSIYTGVTSDTAIQTVARWTIPSFGQAPRDEAELVITNGAGAVVSDVHFANETCSNNVTACRSTGEFDLDWGGFGDCGSDGCPEMPAGIYTATAIVPDSYGRSVEIPLGAVRRYVLTWATYATTRRLPRTPVSHQHPVTVMWHAPSTGRFAPGTLYSVEGAAMAVRTTRFAPGTPLQRSTVVPRGRVLGVSPWVGTARVRPGYVSPELIASWNDVSGARVASRLATSPIEVRVTAPRHHRARVRQIRLWVTYTYWSLK